VVLEPVSANRLHENGSFCGLAWRLSANSRQGCRFSETGGLWIIARKLYNMRGLQPIMAHPLWLNDWLAGAEGIEPRYGDFELGCPGLFDRSYITPISLAFISLSKHSNLENRTKSAESRTPERNGPLEKNELPLPISSPEFKTRNRDYHWANCQQSCAENRLLRPSWRTEWDSNRRYDIGSAVATGWRFPINKKPSPGAAF
jgi:hypothetical protein